MQTITKGRYTAHLRQQSDGVYVITTRDGDCMHGIPGRFYTNMRRAKTGALRMIAKASA